MAHGGHGECCPLLGRDSTSSANSVTSVGSSTDGSTHKINTWMLVGLIYCSVSGGPLGMEVAVRAGGPALALLGFLVFPLIWSIPEAAMTAELSVAYPEAAGFAAWTNAAFGPFWSFQCSMLSYFSGVLDNAVYPVLMLSYIQGNDSVEELSSSTHFLAVVGFTFVLTVLTWRGLDVNGTACILLVAFVLLPFAVFSIVALPQVRVSNWFLGPRDRNAPADDDNDDEYVQGGWGDVKWRTLINILFWNLNYYDSASAFSGDCHDPPKTFPRAMALAVLAITVTYLVPLAVATGANPNARYCDGCFVSIAEDLVGPWLAAWITVAAAVSCVGMFIAEMASDSFQIMGMADNGQLPKFLSVRSRFGTPTFAVAVSALGVVVASQLQFTAIVELVNVLYVFSELIEFAAFVKLRYEHAAATTAAAEAAATGVKQPSPPPPPPRPWEIPGVKTWLHALAFFSPAALMLLVVLALSSVLSFIVAGAAASFTMGCYFFTSVARDRGWIAFEPISEDWGVQRDPVWVQNLARFLSGGAGNRGYATAFRPVGGAESSSGSCVLGNNKGEDLSAQPPLPPQSDSHAQNPLTQN